MSSAAVVIGALRVKNKKMLVQGLWLLYKDCGKDSNPWIINMI